MDAIAVVEDDHVAGGGQPAHVEQAVGQCVPVVAEPLRKTQSPGDGIEHVFLVARGDQVDVQDQATGCLGPGQQLVAWTVRQMMHARGGGIGEQVLVVGNAHRSIRRKLL